MTVPVPIGKPLNFVGRLIEIFEKTQNLKQYYWTDYIIGDTLGGI
jgi:hypothetical protein